MAGLGSQEKRADFRPMVKIKKEALIATLFISLK